MAADNQDAAAGFTFRHPANNYPENDYWHPACDITLTACTGLPPSQSVIISLTNIIKSYAQREDGELHEIIQWLVSLATLNDQAYPSSTQVATGILNLMHGMAVDGLTSRLPPVNEAAGSVGASASANAGAGAGASIGGTAPHGDMQLPKGVKVADVPKSKWAHTRADWFADLDMYFRMHGPVVLDSHKLYLAVHASSQTKPLHSRLKLLMSTRPKITWLEVKKEISDTMYEKDSAKTARDKLAGLRQGKMSAEEYVTRFEQYCFEAGDVQEAEKKDRFMRQMDESLLKEIYKASDPKSYEEMRALATRIDGRRRNPDYGKGSFIERYGRNSGFGNRGNDHRSNDHRGNNNRGGNSGGGPEPMDLNHMGQNKKFVRLTPEEKKLYDEKGWCKYCRSKDHSVDNCPVKPKQSHPKDRGHRQR